MTNCKLRETHVCVILDIDRVKLELGRLGMPFPIAESEVRAGDPSKVHGQVARGPDHPPVVIARHEDLARASVRPSKLEEVIGSIALKGDDLLLPQGIDQRGNSSK